MILSSQLNQYEKAVADRQLRFRIARRESRREAKALRAAKRKVETLEKAQIVVQRVAQFVQQQAHREIADVVSRSLEAVFGETYTFKILFERKRGKTEARLVFEKQGMEVSPMTASGGGIIDVAAFALRLSCLMLSRPPLRRFLVLDEPFKFVSAEYRGRLKRLIEILAEEMGVQILMVTHIDGLQIGKVVMLPKEGDK